MGQYAGNFANNFTVIYGTTQLESGAGIDVNLKVKTGTLNLKKNTASLSGTGVSGKVIF